jgi:hypothetical protein
MSVKLPNGVLLALATAYGSPLTMSAISNAATAVATLNDTSSLNDGNYIEVTSGWSRLNQRIVRVDNLSASPETIELEGINTSDTEDYPPASGAGSVREITTWTQLSQILELTSSGGDQQFVTYSFLEQDFESQLPTVQSPITLTMQIADDPTLAGYIALKAAAESRELTALRATLPDGSKLLYNGYVSFNETPTMTKNQLMAVTATFSLQARPVRYAS